jgi:hypothetical protein
MQGQYSNATSMGNILGNYGDLMLGVTGTREMRHGVSALASLSLTRYQSSSFANYDHLICIIRVGLRSAPGNVPLRIW